ncbi:MAG: urate hydroxylase PuuD [Gammaproteobacteria bacterium]|nr:urate hydroxylase PuuD [Gammaproteobacteria bacterium]
MNPLSSVNGAIVTGIVLMVALALALPGGFDFGNLDRWLHIISGVMWIGLLYYFNVVQIPALAAAGADKGGPGGTGIAKYVAPRALLWFRWSAVITAVSGIIFIEMAYRPAGGGLMQVLMLREGYTIIGIGAWLGLIMLFNVWVLIWPNQKKVIGIVQATDAQKASARVVATMASRTNFVLSVPMLMCMGGQSHGLPF